jgi:hypothetical protein
VISNGLTESDAAEDIDANASDLFSPSTVVFIMSMSRRIYQDGTSVISAICNLLSVICNPISVICYPISIMCL